MVFLKATKTIPPPQKVLEERALEFIDAALTLISAVVAIPVGTVVLTNCGLIKGIGVMCLSEAFFCQHNYAAAYS